MENIIHSSRFISHEIKGKQFFVRHHLNHKKFEVTEGILNILNRLEEPQDLIKLISSFSDEHQPRDIEKVVDFLLKHKLVVKKGEDESFQMVQTSIPFFGFQKYNSNQKDSIVFAGIPYGLGNAVDHSTKRAPEHIRYFLQNQNVNLNALDCCFDFLSTQIDFHTLKQRIKEGKITDAGNLHLLPTNHQELVYRHIYKLVKELISKENKPFLIGGDHSISYPSIKAIAEKYPKFQLIQFDAHFDTYQTGVQDRFEEQKLAVHHHGNFLTHCLKLPQLTKVIQLGIRGYSNLYSKNIHPKMQVFWVDQLDRVDQILKEVSSELPTYITFDIDFFDPSIAPATATPVINGASYTQFMNILKSIFPKLNIVGADLVEVNPNKDQEKISLQLASNIMLLIANYM